MKEGDVCRECPNGCNAGAKFRVRSDTKHYGQMICPKCEAHLDWVAKPDGVKKRPDLKEARKVISEMDYCQICLQPSTHLEAHHIWPVSRGGTNEPQNVMAVCTECHNLIEWRRRDCAQRSEDGHLQDRFLHNGTQCKDSAG